ncbi:MAG: hypothetical protein VYC69_04105, partial [Chloroflexota bacterium]|nr:hypothetical protein [Chloroflexota bacterium]
ILQSTRPSCASPEGRRLRAGNGSPIDPVLATCGVSFGVGYSIGVIKTYVKPPKVNWPASPIAQLHGAMYNSRAG